MIPATFLEANQVFYTELPDIEDDEEENNNKQNTSKALVAPKKTIWNGYCFRSRLEARWALFFEYLSIDYLYECRTFLLNNGHKYTPDFYLPSKKIWLEIKPNYPTEEEREKAQLLSQLPSMQGHRIILLYGSCHAPFIKKFYEGGKGIEFQINKNAIEPVAWTQCKTCNQFDMGYRCQPPCHPDANNQSVQPSIHLQMAYEYGEKVDFEGLNRKVAATTSSSQYF
jgi:hypothetical protein